MVLAKFVNVYFDNGLFFREGCSFITLEVSGHSGFYQNGVDLPCAGISFLTQTFVISIAKLLGVRQDFIKESGYLKSEIYLLNLSDDSVSKLKFLIETLIIGLLEINKEYPGSVKIEFVAD